jgi:transcriptional regulator NrdR family protein
MQCPDIRCNSETRVVETFPDVEETHRLRLCKVCGCKFLTKESEVPMSVLRQLRHDKAVRLGRIK